MIFVVLLLFSTFQFLQSSQIPCREEYESVSLLECPFHPQSLTEAVRWGTLDQVKSFLNYSWNPNEIDENGRTPMHYAILRRDAYGTFILQALMKKQGSIYVRDRFLATPVDDALELGNKDALKLFINYCGLNLSNPMLRKKYPVIDETFKELSPDGQLLILVPHVPVRF